MTQDPLVPALQRHSLGWPKYPNPRGDFDRAQYAPLSVLLSSEFDWDAHFTAYSLPEVPRRLAGSALDRGPRMVLFLVDVEPAGHAPVTDAWLALERSRIAQALADHPGGFCYRTRGGYRLVWRLPAPLELRTRRDRASWRASYLSWLDHLSAAYGIVGDRTCQDWTRLYRLPRVVRDGVRQDLGSLGDPMSVGVWLRPTVEAEDVGDQPDLDLPEFDGLPPDEDLVAAVMELAEIWPRAGRHQAQHALAGGLARAGWPPDAIADLLTAVSHQAFVRTGIGVPGGEADKREKTAARAVAMVAEGADVTGWPSLGRLLGEGEPRLAGVLAKLGIQAGGVRPDPMLGEALLRVAAAAEAARPPASIAASVAGLVPPAPTGAPPSGMGRGMRSVLGRNKPPVVTYETGIVELDALLGGGVATRQLLILCAPPADGKSALAVDLAIRLESDVTASGTPKTGGGVPVLYVSTELEADEVMGRAAANVLNELWRDAVRGRLDRDRLMSAAADGDRERRIWVIGCEEIPRDVGAAAELIGRTALEMLALFGRAPVIVVDYLQDLARGGDEKGLRSRVGDIATGLRALSQSLDCPVIAVSSVSRSYYGAAKQDSLRGSLDPRVYLAAMKESGDVDYAAATAIFLDVDPAPEVPKGTDPRTVSRPGRIAIAKCRHGDVGFVGARFCGATGRWYSDPTALDQLTGTAPSEGKRLAQHSADDDMVYERIRSLQNAGNPMSQTELRGLFKGGIGKHRCEESIARMMGTRIRQRTVGYAGAGGGMHKKQVLVTSDYVGADEVPIVVPPPDPNSPVASWLGALRPEPGK